MIDTLYNNLWGISKYRVWVDISEDIPEDGVYSVLNKITLETFTLTFLTNTDCRTSGYIADYYK